MAGRAGEPQAILLRAGLGALVRPDPLAVRGQLHAREQAAAGEARAVGRGVVLLERPDLRLRVAGQDSLVGPAAPAGPRNARTGRRRPGREAGRARRRCAASGRRARRAGHRRSRHREGRRRRPANRPSRGRSGALEVEVPPPRARNPSQPRGGTPSSHSQRHRSQLLDSNRVVTYPAYMREKARQLRMEQGLTIDEIAERFEVSRTTIYFWVGDMPRPARCVARRGPNQALGNKAMQAKYKRLRDEAYELGGRSSPGSTGTRRSVISFPSISPRVSSGTETAFRSPTQIRRS